MRDIKKQLVITIGLEYSHVPDFEEVDELNPIYWILLRILDFRVSFIFLCLAIYFSYVLSVNVYDESYNQKHRIFIIVYTIFTGTFSLLMYQRANLILDSLAFFFVFLLMFLVYLPFYSKSYKAYKSVDDPVFKKGFLSLALMSISFILILLFFLIDRILVMFPGLEYGFSIFYFLAWISGACALTGAYFGYIRPKSSE